MAAITGAVMTRAATPMLPVASANPVMITAAIANAVMIRAATPMLLVANVSLVMITAEGAKQG